MPSLKSLRIRNKPVFFFSAYGIPGALHLFFNSYNKILFVPPSLPLQKLGIILGKQYFFFFRRASKWRSKMSHNFCLMIK